MTFKTTLPDTKPENFNDWCKQVYGANTVHFKKQEEKKETWADIFSEISFRYSESGKEISELEFTEKYLAEKFNAPQKK